MFVSFDIGCESVVLSINILVPVVSFSPLFKIVLKRFIFLSEKELIDSDIKIDDSVYKLKGKAEIKLLFTAYHNKNITADELKEKKLTRVNSWKEIEKILL